MNIPQSLESTRIEPSLAERLRSETRPQHRALESLTPMSRLFDVDYTLREYAGMLSVWADFFRVFDPQLSRCAAFAYQRRSPALAHDLHALDGYPALPGTPHRHDHRIWLPDNEAERVGALYVIEGSTLGARVITRRLNQQFGASVQGALHFYGLQTVHWPEFRTRLDQWGVAHPEQVSVVIEAAGRTFETIGEWLDAIRRAPVDRAKFQPVMRLRS